MGLVEREEVNEMRPVQLCRQCRHNSIPISGPLLVEDVQKDAPTDLPVEQNQGRIDTA